MTEQLVLVDDPAEGVRRITLNRPEKRNALSNALRGQLFEALHAADADTAVHVTIIRGAGKVLLGRLRARRRQRRGAAPLLHARRAKGSGPVMSPKDG